MGLLNKKGPDTLFILAIFLVSLLLYHFSNTNHIVPGGDHYVYLANAFLHGRVNMPDIPKNYVDIFNVNGRFVTVLPPMPAVLLMPFAFFLGINFTQLPIAQLLGAVNITLVWVLLSKLNFKTNIKLFLTILFGFGTVHWFATEIGTAWYLAHLTAVFFLLLSLLVFFGTKRYFFAGVLLGFAFFGRDSLLLGSLFFLTYIFLETEPFKILIDKKRILNLTLFFVGLSISLIGYFSYNNARFNNYFDNGRSRTYQYYMDMNIKHNLLRAIVPDNYPHFGLFDWRNIPLHLDLVFFRGPEIRPSFPFFSPSVYGTSVLLTSPLLLLAIFSLSRKKETIASWVGAIAIAVTTFVWVSQGWVQFGYRFILDYLPFLIIILAYKISTRISVKNIVLLVWSIIVNFWGVWWWFLK
jgi:hypothetical protein